MSDTTVPTDLDYLVRDYPGFRELMLNILAGTQTTWAQRSAADLGVMLVELLAAELDQLSYATDRVSAEMYLESARLRDSVRQHAALGGYAMFPGAADDGLQHVRLRLSRALAMPQGARIVSDAPLDDPLTFETTEDVLIIPGLERLSLDQTAAAGDTMLSLSGAEDLQAQGLAADALMLISDGAYSESVRIASVSPSSVELTEPLRYYHPPQREVLCNIVPIRQGRTLAWAQLGIGGASLEDVSPERLLQLRLQQLRELSALAGQQRSRMSPEQRADLQVIQRAIAAEVAALRAVGEPELIGDMGRESDANLQAAARGLCLLLSALGLAPPAHLAPSSRVPWPGQRLALPVDQPHLWVDGEPTIRVRVRAAAHDPWVAWSWTPELLESAPDSRHFTLEWEQDRQVRLRFGDGIQGALLPPGATVEARWVSGQPGAPPVGRGQLRRVELRDGELEQPSVLSTTNPVATRGGVGPEPLDEVRRAVPNQPLESIPATPEQLSSQLGQLDSVRDAAARVSGPLIDAVVRLESGVSLSRAWEEIRQELSTKRLAGSFIQLHRARQQHVSIAVQIDISAQGSDEEIRASAHARLGTWLREGLGLGEALQAATLVEDLAQITGINSAQVVALDFADKTAPINPPALKPAWDTYLLCLDQQHQPRTGVITLYVREAFTPLMYSAGQITPADRQRIVEALDGVGSLLDQRLSERDGADQTRFVTPQVVQQIIDTLPLSSPVTVARLKHRGVRVSRVRLSPGKVPGVGRLIFLRAGQGGPDVAP